MVVMTVIRTVVSAESVYLATGMKVAELDPA